MSDFKTMGQQFGRRSWAEPWKIKMVEPIHMITREAREKAAADAATAAAANAAAADNPAGPPPITTI